MHAYKLLVPTNEAPTFGVPTFCNRQTSSGKVSGAAIAVKSAGIPSSYKIKIYMSRICTGGHGDFQMLISTSPSTMQIENK